MAEETKQQIQTAINVADEKTKEQNEPIQSNDNEPPKCHCGQLMIKKKPSYYATEPQCFGCGYRFKKVKDEDIYTCPAGKVAPHKNGFLLCLKCSKEDINSTPIKDIHNRQKLYYIYNDNKINGPLNTDEILQMYIKKQLKENRMYIMSANGDDEWTKLEFPESICSELDEYDEKRCDRWEQCEKINSEIKQKYPDLYDGLVKDIFFEKLLKIIAPTKIPKQEKASLSSFKWFMKLLGQILAISMAILISLHCLPTIIIFGCGCLLCVYCATQQVEDENVNNYILLIWIISIYSGLVISPFLVVHFILTESDQWNEIQSWMIAYISWGIFSFIIPTSNSIVIIFFDEEMSRKFTETMNNILLVIIGVDLCGFDILKDFDEWKTRFSALLLLPSLASVLPAAICGFIANYVLEEKFELKCSEDIVNNNLCFESKHGCCEIISSHDVGNSYTFIGGLASNILATWAIIRFCGYLFVNAIPEFSLYAKRKK